MSLLQEIQQAATDSTVDLPTLLRKCKILAVRLANDDLRNWVDHELEGYGDSELPKYRILRVASYGHFLGIGGAQLKNMPIPPRSGSRTISRIRDAGDNWLGGVSAIAQLIKDTPEGFVQMPWSADMAAYVSDQLYDDYSLMSAWRTVPVSGFVAILDTVRTRILNFTLQLEDALPEGESQGDARDPGTREKVEQAFVMNIYGPVGNIASGSSGVEQRAIVAVGAGELRALHEQLSSIGISEQETHELDQALEEDKRLDPAQPIGHKTSAWICKTIGKASKGLLKVGSDVAASMITKMISQYLGLPQ